MKSGESEVAADVRFVYIRTCVHSCCRIYVHALVL